ncbi:MAG: penicillin-binding transpeptidase domain-containing protein, partial [Acidimicrobiales bacterium]
YVATFGGFVPANDPQLSIVVVIDEPSGDVYGGDVSGPVFSRLAGAVLRAYRIPPPSSIVEAG